MYFTKVSVRAVVTRCYSAPEDEVFLFIVIECRPRELEQICHEPGAKLCNYQGGGNYRKLTGD